MSRQDAGRSFRTAWMQAIVIVVLCGFLILGMLAYRTYTDEPPIPSQVVDPERTSHIFREWCNCRPGGVSSQRP